MTLQANPYKSKHDRLLWMTLCILVIGGMVALRTYGKAKKPSADADKPGPTTPDLPADLTQASFRMAALDTLYELDLSLPQLRGLRNQAMGAGAAASASSASDEKLAGKLKVFHEALLQGSDDEAIAKARNDVVDQAENVEGLDDVIHPTDASLTRAPEVCKILRASQIAAYLASHADEVSDPAELMVNSVDEIREASATEAPGIVEKTADDVGRLVAGLDKAKAKDIAGRVVDWLKGPTASKDEITESRRELMEESARKIVGDVTSMQVLNHWMESEMAILLSNPQLPQAIDEMIAVRQARMGD
jgi:hypothetical protein